MNKVLYKLEYKVVDKLGRAKKTKHIGVFDDLEKLEQAKIKTIASNPGVVFEIYPIEHLFFEQRSF